MHTIYQAVANGAYVTNGRDTAADARDHARRVLGYEQHMHETYGDAPPREWEVVASRWNGDRYEEVSREPVDPADAIQWRKSA